MKDWWIRFGCFLTGHNYQILRNCSEASSKSVKKYTAALIIVSILWGFIGFKFCQLYLDSSNLVSFIIGIIMVIIVIQIERQIILAVGKNRNAAIFRSIIGVVIALIGSIIIDQTIFNGDINIQKNKNLTEKVIKELDNQIAQLDTVINDKELELNQLFDNFRKNPTTPIIGAGTSKYEKDSTGRMVLVGLTRVTQTMENPIAKRIPIQQALIDTLRTQQAKISNNKIAITAGASLDQIFGKEKEVYNGFLEELKVMKKILSENNEALIVWILFFIFFIAIELFVLVNKFGDNLTDYDETIIHQKELHSRKLNELSKLNIDLKFKNEKILQN